MLSVFAWFGFELPKEELFPMIKRVGFEGVTFWWSGYPNQPDYRLQPELARKAGLHVENVHAPYYESSSLWEDSEEGEAFARILLNGIDECAAHEIPAMVMHPCRTDAPPASEIGFRRFAAIIERAEQRGVNVAIENLDAPTPIERAALLLERFDSPRFGLCFDSGHHNARTVVAPETDLLARFGHRLMALHLHDNDGTDDQHRLPFNGNIDWPFMMRRIKATGYLGNIHLEIRNDDCRTLPPEAFLAQAYQRAVRLSCCEAERAE